jgi:GNAT superfamily N-acetyltransferase
MATINATLAPVRHPSLVIRTADPADHAAIRGVLRNAYAPYGWALPAAVFRLYLADLLDLDRHARHGQLLVAEVDGLILGSVTFYPDASRQGVGWPVGWAGGRGLAVHANARGNGLARALLAACEGLARGIGAPIFAFHTTAFMTKAISLYEGLGYRRAPEYDLGLDTYFGIADAAAIRAIAYRRDLIQAPAC